MQSAKSTTLGMGKGRWYLLGVVGAAANILGRASAAAPCEVERALVQGSVWPQLVGRVGTASLELLVETVVAVDLALVRTAVLAKA